MMNDVDSINPYLVLAYDVYDVYDVYYDSRRYTNATNTPTSDIMKEMVLY